MFPVYTFFKNSGFCLSLSKECSQISCLENIKINFLRDWLTYVWIISFNTWTSCSWIINSDFHTTLRHIRIISWDTCYRCTLTSDHWQIVLMPLPDRLPFYTGEGGPQDLKNEFDYYRCRDIQLSAIRGSVPEVCKRHVFSISSTMQEGGLGKCCSTLPDITQYRKIQMFYLFSLISGWPLKW